MSGILANVPQMVGGWLEELAWGHISGTLVLAVSSPFSVRTASSPCGLSRGLSVEFLSCPCKKAGYPASKGAKVEAFRSLRHKVLRLSLHSIGFSTLAPLTFGAREFFVVGTVLCIVGPLTLPWPLPTSC